MHTVSGVRTGADHSKRASVAGSRRVARPICSHRRSSREVIGSDARAIVIAVDAVDSDSDHDDCNERQLERPSPDAAKRVRAERTW